MHYYALHDVELTKLSRQGYKMHQKTHRAYLWTYCPGALEPIKAVVYDFADKVVSRAGEHARAFLDPWRGQLVCDDFAGYKQLSAQGMIEVGCPRTP